MKRTLFDRLGDFVLGKGFYIVLFLCVATIGISGYYLIRSFTPAPEPVLDLEPAAGNPSITLPDTSAAVPSRPVQPVPQTDPAEETDSQPQQPAAPQPEVSTQAPAQLSDAPAVYTWPVKGQIIHGYSLEVLAYDETMGDWRTHSGVDIAAGEGFRVMAISDGTVQDVYQDDLMGTTVVVDHGDGLTSSYSNLNEITDVAVGDSVETGTVLGTVGSTAIAESGRASHLHLEMSQNGQPVDPAGYLPE